MGKDDAAIVVTGAAGFIGGRTAQRLAEEGRRVIALDLPGRDWTHLASTRAETREADLSVAGSLSRVLAGVRPAAIVHCAALMGGFAPLSEYRRVNVEGTRQVTQWAALSGCGRLVCISSVTVYGLPPVRDVSESFPHRRAGIPYADSKIEAEEVIGRARSEGLACSILRPGDVYGPRSTEWVVKLVDAMRAGRMVLIGGGRGLVNVTYVDNLVDAVLAALASRSPQGADCIITDGEPVTWRCYLEALARAAGCSPPRLSIPAAVAWPAVIGLEAASAVTGRRPPLSRLGLRLLTSRCSYSIERARRELSWTPRVGLAEGMARVGAWLRGSPG